VGDFKHPDVLQTSYAGYIVLLIQESKT